MPANLQRFTLLAWLALAGCADQVAHDGVDEPLRVHQGQFVEGALPGEPPPEPGSSDPLLEPTTTGATADDAYLRPRLASVGFTGLASEGASAVGVRFAEIGTGYWIVPTGLPDPQSDNSATWRFVADLGAALPPGRHELVVVAFDADGKPGTQATTSMCIRSPIPDNGNACAPQIAPPALVISLGWDSPVDLDLKVKTPGGQVIETSRPSSGPTDAQGAIDADAPGAGYLDLDSNRDCQIDGRQRENVVFETQPRRGTYVIYANLKRACHEDAVSYVASYQFPAPADDGEFGVTLKHLGAGTLLAPQANGDTKLGTFIGEIKLQ